MTICEIDDNEKILRQMAMGRRISQTGHEKEENESGIHFVSL